jgi:hypothetical protein
MASHIFAQVNQVSSQAALLLAISLPKGHFSQVIQ